MLRVGGTPKWGLRIPLQWSALYCKLRLVDGLTVKLFKGQTLGLSDEAEDHSPGNEVESCIESD